MSDPADKRALTLLTGLESRIRRITFFLSGNDEGDETLQQVAAQGRDETVQARLARLESNLARLSSRSPVVYDLLKLRECYSMSGAWTMC